ncbi:uncharacterized protein LOC113335317 [Papaver somniferum]|uniref:uncharacterized protein LOC113335317 n=1 Tax=Papaver somniferum TaxID=3469 RepID=UPI000E6FFA05|nr:uncharacterized protein LOC113335317 [Papaver somniferum]
MAELEQSKIIDKDVIFAVNECDWKVSMTTTLKTWREVLDINTQLAEGLKPECLLKLYDLLISLSVDSLSRCPGENFTDIRKMSNFLFEELSGRLEHLFSNVGQHILCSDSWGLLQELTLLLRCCISMLHLLEFDLSLLIEKCQILLSILRILCSPEIASTAGRKGKSVCITSVSCAFFPVLHSIIEVFINEFLVHKKLGDYFTTLETVSSTSDNLFRDPLNQGSGDVVLELISSHFLLSISDEPTFKNSLEPFLLLCDEKPPFLDLISLNAAMQLLSTIVIYSPPQILQAHMISLVSRCSSISMASYNQASDPRLVNWYISAFEISVDLYSQNMSSLQLGDTHGEPKSGFGCSDKQCTAGGLSHLSFESHIRRVMYSQLKVHTTNFPTSVHLLPLKTKSDYKNACIAYMKENQNILNVSSRDESFSVLSNIISRILSGDIGTSKLWEKGNISQQKMYLLASIVNLMSSSLLQTIWTMQKGSLGNAEMRKRYSQCKEYDMIISKISCFQQCSITPQSICTLVADMMAHYPARHKHSKMMFMHFASLLLFSFEAGLEFLSKSCILMLMTLMNLFNLEKGNLDALKHLEVESLSSPCSNKLLVVTSSSLLKSLGLYARALQRLDF